MGAGLRRRCVPLPAPQHRQQLGGWMRSLQGWGAGLLPATHRSHEKCLKRGREMKDLQDSAGKTLGFFSAIPHEGKIFSSFFLIVYHPV